MICCSINRHCCPLLQKQLDSSLLYHFNFMVIFMVIYKLPLKKSCCSCQDNITCLCTYTYTISSQYVTTFTCTCTYHIYWFILEVEILSEFIQNTWLVEIDLGRHMLQSNLVFSIESFKFTNFYTSKINQYNYTVHYWDYIHVCDRTACCTCQVIPMLVVPL